MAGVAGAAIIAVVGSMFQGPAAAQEEYGDAFGEFVTAPERLAAFRSLAEDISAPEPFQDVTLSWVSPGADAGCFTIEVERVTESGLDGRRSWEVLDRMPDRTQSRYLHLNVPTSEKVCYRVYSSNRLGRSDYSNRVCLLELVSGIGEGESAGATDQAGMDMGGEGIRVWQVLVIALVGGAVLATGGVVGWRYRARRLGV